MWSIMFQMRDGYEINVTTTQSDETVSAAHVSSLENRISIGSQSSRTACDSCATKALCGIAANELTSQIGTSKLSASSRITETYGVTVDAAGMVCSKKLVTIALTKNLNGEFWVLQSDDLTHASLEVKAAETVQLAAVHIASVIKRGMSI